MSTYGDMNIDYDSPQMNSMGAIDVKMARFDSVNNSCPTDGFNTFKNKLGAANENYKLNTHKKQDKSKVHKYSPFQKKELKIDSKRKSRLSSIKGKSGSNSFLGGAPVQRAAMKIKKGHPSQKKTKEPKLSAPLKLLSQTSFARNRAKEGTETELKVCPEVSEHTQSADICPVQKSETNLLDVNKEKDEEILQMSDREMEAPDSKE